MAVRVRRPLPVCRAAVQTGQAHQKRGTLLLSPVPIDDVLTHHQRLDWKDVRDLAAQPTHTSTNGRAATRRPSTLI